MEVSYNTIRGSLNVTPDQNQNQPLNQNQILNLGPKDSSSCSFLIFDGLDLTEDGLKDWLRLCAEQVGSVEPVPIHRRSFQGNLRFVCRRRRAGRSSRHRKWSTYA